MRRAVDYTTAAVRVHTVNCKGRGSQVYVGVKGFATHKREQHEGIESASHCCQDGLEALLDSFSIQAGLGWCIRLWCSGIMVWMGISDSSVKAWAWG